MASKVHDFNFVFLGVVISFGLLLAELYDDGREIIHFVGAADALETLLRGDNTDSSTKLVQLVRGETKNIHERNNVAFRREVQSSAHVA